MIGILSDSFSKFEASNLQGSHHDEKKLTRKGDPEYISKSIGSLRFKDSKVFVGIGLFNKTELIVFLFPIFWLSSANNNIKRIKNITINGVKKINFFILNILMYLSFFVISH